MSMVIILSFSVDDIPLLGQIDVSLMFTHTEKAAQQITAYF